jgi:hypothetical protein
MVRNGKLDHPAVERGASPNKRTKEAGTPKSPDWYGKAELSISAATRNQS